MFNLFKKFTHTCKWEIVARSNALQLDEMGYPLRLFIVKCPICGKSDQQWIDVSESACEEINTGESVLIKWDNVKYSEL